METSDGYDANLGRLFGELSERICTSIPTAECGTPTLQVGDADECRVRSRGHGGNSIGGGAGSIAMDVAGTRRRWRDGLHGLDEGPRKASETQVGGNHYSKYPIQPSQYNEANGLSWCQGNIIKYATRYRDKKGAKDIAKAIHYAMLILEWEYGTTYEEVQQDD